MGAAFIELRVILQVIADDAHFVGAGQVINHTSYRLIFVEDSIKLTPETYL